MINYMEELRTFYWMRIKVRSVLIVKVQKKINPLRGYLFLKGLTKDGNSWTDGNILDPANGKEYDCTLTLDAAPLKLNVRGFIGFSFLGRTQVWKRSE